MSALSLEEQQEHPSGFALTLYAVHKPSDKRQSLLSYLPGVSQEALASVIIGGVASRHNVSGNYLLVLRALILHVGWHSYRVWVSALGLQQRIREEMLPNLEGGRQRCPSRKTIERAMQYWAQTVLRPITNPAEIQDGPGEWTVKSRGIEKKGEGPVNHYDTAPLLGYIPEEILNGYLALVTGRQIIFKLPGKQPQPKDGQVYSQTDIQDPFESSNPQYSSQACGPSPSESISPTLHETECNVPHKYPNSEKTPSPITPNRPLFVRTNLSDRSKKLAHTRENNPASDKEAGLFQPNDRQGWGVYHRLSKKHRLLVSRERGGCQLDPPGAKALIAEMVHKFGEAGADRFLSELTEYFKWLTADDGKERDPGWYLGTFRQWPGYWSDKFEQHLDRQRAAKARELGEKEQGHVQASRQAIAVPEPEKRETVVNLPPPSEAHPPIWLALLAAVQEQLESRHYRMYFTSLSWLGMEDNGATATVTIFVPASHREPIERKYGSLIRTLLTRLVGKLVDLRYSVQERKRAP